MKPDCRLPFVSRAPRFFTCGILAVSAWFCLQSEKARAAAYTFTNIADTNGIFAPTTMNAAGLGDAPLSLNNAGTVAFATRLDNNQRGVFSGNGGPIQSIALTSGPVFLGLGGASINSAGTVAFVGILESGMEGIFTGSGGQVTALALDSEPTFSGFLDPVINNAGTVAFTVGFTDGSYGIVTRSGGATTAIALESGPIFSGVGANISINSSGTVAFFGRLENGQFGLFSGNGGPPMTFGLGSNFRDGLSLNDAGSITFISRDGTAVYVGNGGGLMTIASTSGPYIGFGTYSVINNFGEVVFLAGLDNGGGGIFTGPDPVADKVIRIGDSLFGSSLISTSLRPGGENFGNMDVNDLGQVAFHYELADGRQGIALASPVPEPSSLSLFLLAVGLIAGRRRSHPVPCG